ncbi:hypothetical protein FOCC_FOCC014119 [Frankliniella occidentalis]|uniref:Zinc finger BED domain-containing protein 4-like n=1 Tax=Frankliniella occidentalis TaxID=133901 RepID=A0A6J1TDN2_FRAOC|nr:zinc finger BED domain-containing protein 4-like [Frankliniella occidentalis]KAE8740381.1 hypothetical protein FOCC_FOCC014119 [Frankliniella occidentalis]
MLENEEFREDDPGQPSTPRRPSGSIGQQQKTLASYFQSGGRHRESAPASDIPVTPAVASENQHAQDHEGSVSSTTTITTTLSQEEQEKVSVPHALIWHYFIKIDKNHGKCKFCEKILNTPTGATTLLIRHLLLHPSSNGEYIKLQKYKVAQKKISASKKSDKSNNAPSVKSCLFPLDPRGQKSQNITNAIGLFICKSLQPYSVVEEEGFTNLMHLLEPRYLVPSRFAFSRTVIPSIYNDLKKRLQEKLDAVRDDLESVCFTTDVWTSRKLKSFLAFTMQFINNQFEMERFTLECQPFPGCHNGEAIYNRMQEMIRSLQLESEEIAKYIISDNGSNFLAALGEPTEGRRIDEEIAEVLRNEKDWEHGRCFNHTAQLAINDAKKELGINNVIEKVSHIVRRYSKSKNAVELYEQFQKEHGLPKHELIQRVKTRWDSDFRMLERAVEQKAAIVSELSAAGEENLSAVEWKLAEGFVEVLRPVANHTAEMGSETGPTASMILPVIFEIESELEDFIRKAPRGSGIQFARKLLAHIQARFLHYKTNLTCKTAMLVDPRYKDILQSDNWASTAREILEEKAEEKYYSRVRKGLVSSTDSSRDESEEPPAKKGRWKFLQKINNNRGSTINSTATLKKKIKDEVESYLSLPTLEADEDPLVWWRSNQSVFPNLSLVAKQYLGIAATETASERVASVGSNTETSKRTNLSSSHLSQIVFCHDNAVIPQHNNRRK